MTKIFSILLALALLVGLGLVTAAPVLAGTIRYVPSVYPTIQAAINASSNGDTIMVAAGNYGAFVVQNKTNITIIGAEGATVTTANSIDVGLPTDTWAMAGVFGSQNITIKGINFNGAGVNGTNVFGIAYVDSTGRITGLTVANVNGTELGIGIAIMDSVSTSTVEITGSTISNNDEGIYAGSDSTQEIHFNNIVGNTHLGVWNDGGVIVNATNNWWGHASGPYEETLNPDGLGDAVGGNVDFTPWLGASVVTKTVNNGTVDAKAEADTEVLVTGTATVTVSSYLDNPGGDLPTGFSSLGKYIDVYVPDTTNVTEIEIRLYYTDAQVTAANVSEDSLRLFWWNDSVWAQCSDSGLNPTSIDGYSGYMWAKIRTNTTPSLDFLKGQGWTGGGYHGGSETPQGCGCFIATAAYGTDTAKEIDILREFRDKVLLPNSLGAKFVSFYYRTSPPLADFISQHEALRTAVRVGFVDPIVKILKWTHDLWSTRGS